eukprot:gb/GEZN01006536.1/.p1 GENE.gb/GEZN01006536.1/~~gb/GEZN01006536.1/.p1  ORF type:complete len:483 (+),score=27.35 gb/GEZN01006536.1/:54-1502(+)
MHLTPSNMAVAVLCAAALIWPLVFYFYNQLRELHPLCGRDNRLLYVINGCHFIWALLMLSVYLFDASCGWRMCLYILGFLSPWPISLRYGRLLFKFEIAFIVSKFRPKTQGQNISDVNSQLIAESWFVRHRWVLLPGFSILFCVAGLIYTCTAGVLVLTSSPGIFHGECDGQPLPSYKYFFFVTGGMLTLIFLPVCWRLRKFKADSFGILLEAKIMLVGAVVNMLVVGCYFLGILTGINVIEMNCIFNMHLYFLISVVWPLFMVYHQQPDSPLPVHSGNLTLSHILEDPRLEAQFADYLRSEFSEENLEFLIRIREFREDWENRTANTTDLNPSCFLNRPPGEGTVLALRPWQRDFQNIYQTYVQPNAPFFLNLTWDVIQDFNQVVELVGALAVLEAAYQEVVWCLISTGVVDRFDRYYKTHLAHLNEQKQRLPVTIVGSLLATEVCGPDTRNSLASSSHVDKSFRNTSQHDDEAVVITSEG